MPSVHQAVAAVVERLPDGVRRRMRRAPAPEWTSPMLATLVDRPFSGPDWIFERKYDGVRCMVFRHGGNVRLMSRNRNLLNSIYPELVHAFESQPLRDFIADGEIVAVANRQTSFARLQNRLGVRNPPPSLIRQIPVSIFLFDILHVAGFNLTALPLRARKEMLKAAIRFKSPVRYSTHRNQHGERYFEDACRKGWEGLIAKRADSSYQHQRSKDWLKFKCTRRQEFVIGGLTEPQGSRIGFGALLVGYYQAGKLRYAGKVGTGYSDALLRQLTAALKAIEIDRSPFADRVREPHPHWVKPVLIAEIGFTEWTRDGKLRHPRFIGLRTDKNPHKVVRETT